MKRSPSRIDLHSDETLEENEHVPTVQQKINKICEIFLKCSEFVTAPFTNSKQLNKFIESNKKIKEKFILLNEEFSSWLSSEETKLEYFRSITGKDFYDGPTTSSSSLTEGNAEELKYFLSSYPKITQFLYSKLEIISQLSQQYLEYKAVEEVKTFFLDNEDNLKLFFKLFSKQYLHSLINTVKKETQDKSYPFSLECLNIINSFIEQDLPGFKTLVDISQDNKSVPEKKGSLLKFFNNNLSAALFWADPQIREQMNVLIGIHRTRKDKSEPQSPGKESLPSNNTPPRSTMFKRRLDFDPGLQKEEQKHPHTENSGQAVVSLTKSSE